jgi:hypothetical protein
MKKEEKKMAQLKCEKCGTTLPVPKHCGKDMIIRNGKFVCWMNLPKNEGGLGMNCGEAPIPNCPSCGKLMQLK